MSSLLLTWGVFDTPDAEQNDNPSQPSKPLQVVKETPEQRELRLREEYERALRTHQNEELNAAKLQFEHIAADLNAHRQARDNQTHPPAKRPRTDGTPLWERRLRYAVHRNLAEVRFELQDYRPALAAYSAALDDDRSDFLIWVRAARAAARCGRLHVARRAYETALKMRPSHWLCRSAYRAVLEAIGDADEDFASAEQRMGDEDPGVDKAVVSMIEDRVRCMNLESEEEKEKAPKAPELIKLKELTWDHLVDSLRKCLDDRLLGKPPHHLYPIAYPVNFELPTQANVQDDVRSISDQESDDVEIVTANSEQEAGIDENDVSIVLVQTENDRGADSDQGTDKNQGQSAKSKSATTQQIANDPDEVIMVSPGNNNDREGREELTEKPDAENRSDSVSPREGGGQKDSSVGAKLGNANNQQQVLVTSVKAADENEPKQPEVRRSSRQRAQSDSMPTSGARRSTRTISDAKDSIQEDDELIKSMIRICIDDDKQKGKVSPEKTSLSTAPNGKNSSGEIDDDEELAENDKYTWVKFVNEDEEAKAVRECVQDLNAPNSGPPDVLVKVLERLSMLKVSQYSSTLALLWSILHDTLQLHMPQNPTITVLIAEAMLESGKKAGKAKIQRFQEAYRLLTHVDISSSDQREHQLLRMRISWLWSILHECRGEMQLSFTSAEETLSIVQETGGFDPIDFPETLGPSLSRYSRSELDFLFKRRISNLKMARDLERAREELKNGKADEDAAKRTVAILSSSVHSSVRALELDRWRDDDLKIGFEDETDLQKWEERLDGEAELEPQLAVFGEACAGASDSIGELICFSIRLRMAVHYYAAQLRTEMQSDETVQHKGQDSSTGRLTDLLIQIRKYVAVIKKLAMPSSSHLWNCEESISGWSMKQAATISAITLTSLTALIITKIPLVRFASLNTELGASQKNRRLGFTRCMLAFARCALLILRCMQNDKRAVEHDDLELAGESHITKKILYVFSFCLRALVGRGCCREEGTSGALIKLYMKYLLSRLQEVACHEQQKKHTRRQTVGISNVNGGTAEQRASNENVSASEVIEDENPSTDDSESDLNPKDEEYEWRDIAVIRNELSQCFQCLFQMQELEPVPSSLAMLDDARWLEEGCRVSKHIGLSFTTGEPSNTSASMDTDTCKSVFFFYRQRIFEGICLRRRDGGRAKRVRDILSQIAEALPEDAPTGVKMLPFSALDNIVSDIVETRDDISREAAESVSRLEAEWNRTLGNVTEVGKSIEEQIRSAQLSILFFEVFALHAMELLAIHDSEYKKQKNAERRKGPKEAADRLLAASSECLIALRSRPWSVGAWILLGRIYVEISDLALDERELSLSSFGLYRAEDLSTLGDGETVETIFGRAEACFGFATSLLKHPWVQRASQELRGLSSAQVLGFAYDGDDSESWCGFGDDGDLFGSFGLTNETTSRPQLQFEPHPIHKGEKIDTRRIAAIRLGEAAISVLRLREVRYFHVHWTQSKTEAMLPTHPPNRFPDGFIKLRNQALSQLRQGHSLLDTKSSVVDVEATGDSNNGNNTVISKRGMHWRVGFSGLERMKWYYLLLEAKLLRKAGGPPKEYLRLFHQSLEENKALRKNLKQPCDIEPLYKLHSSRMKILRSFKDHSNAGNVLTLLEKYSFKGEPAAVDVVRGAEKEADDWIMERKISIAEDIMAAMSKCCDPKSDVTYAEYYFKPTYCRALILAEVLKDTKGALVELHKLFGAEAAAKVLDQGPDGVYRGYFYKMWNYRITDTGIEPALETERRFVRWRGRVLGLYAQLLRQTGEWRLLATMIYRLRKRSLEDLPVDGALLDDLVEAYAVTSRIALLTSLERGILSNAAVFESSYRRTWDIYIETLRLAQGVKRVRIGENRGDKSETGAKQLLTSGRPRCLIAIHTALRLEHLRWKSATGNEVVDLEAMKALPMHGEMKHVNEEVRLNYVETIQVSASKWPLAEKLMKLLMRRISEYGVTAEE